METDYDNMQARGQCDKDVDRIMAMYAFFSIVYAIITILTLLNVLTLHTNKLWV